MQVDTSEICRQLHICSNGSGSLDSNGKSPESPLSIFSKVIQFYENPSVSSILGKEADSKFPHNGDFSQKF